MKTAKQRFAPRLAGAVRATWGRPCPSPHPGCVLCQAWATLARTGRPPVLDADTAAEEAAQPYVRRRPPSARAVAEGESVARLLRALFPRGAL